MTEKELLALVEALERGTLEDWVARGFVRPGQGDDGSDYDDSDVARVRLLCSLRDDLAVNDEALPVVVSLLDQMYSLRRALQAMTTALGTEAPDVRTRVTRSVRTELRLHR